MPDPLPGVAGVRFRNAGKISYFDAVGMRLEAGDYVLVESVRGPEVGRVVFAPGQVVVNELNLDELPPILRMATEDDLRRADALRTKAQELLPEARQLAAGAGFPAHIDSAEFSLDGRRLTFSFTSEERLDYRDFLRRASERFGAKVDMRQLGARDRAKHAGGYGICGRELCCANWLATFPSISIRMAKEQELPLNPQKISGLCGRLLCCLSYEEEGYREMRQTLPKVGQRCSTPTSEGRVIAVNILRRQVTLLVDGQRIEVGDWDLGTVVRWDPSSKAAAPPPSLTRAEAIAAGLLPAEDPATQPPEEPGIDWITGERFGASTSGAGTGRISARKPTPRTPPPPRPDGASGPRERAGQPAQGRGNRGQQRQSRPQTDAPSTAEGGRPSGPQRGAPRRGQRDAAASTPPQAGPRTPQQRSPQEGGGPPPALAGAQARSFRRSAPPPQRGERAPTQPPGEAPPGAENGGAGNARRGRRSRGRGDGGAGPGPNPAAD